jgi:hypothetical protein
MIIIEALAWLMMLVSVLALGSIIGFFGTIGLLAVSSR